MNKKHRQGFTLTEIVVVLAIMVLLVSIAVPSLTHFIHLSQFNRNNNYAETMFLSAESSLTDIRTNGSWQEIKRRIMDSGTLNTTLSGDKTDRIYAIILDKGEYKDVLSDDGSIVVDLLDFDTYDKSILSQTICIEVDVDSGHVYSVFYTGSADSLYYGASTEAAPPTNSLDLDERSYDDRYPVRLGYYSSEDIVNTVSLDLMRLKVTSINLINSETLTLSWSSNARSNRNVEFEINLIDKDTSEVLFTSALRGSSVIGSNSVTNLTTYATLEDIVSGNTFVFPLTFRDGRFSLTLDAMMTADLIKTLSDTPSAANISSTSITRLGEKFEIPRDIYATVKVNPTYEDTTDSGEYRASTAFPSNVANTMFSDGSTTLECGVGTFRHLSNIRYMSGKDSVFTLKGRSIDWSSSSVVMYESGTGGRPAVCDRSVNTYSFPSIASLEDGQTLKASSAGATPLQNLNIDEGSVPSDGAGGVYADVRYLGLILENHGNIENVTLTAPVVSLTKDSGIVGVGSVCGMSDASMDGVSVIGAGSVNIEKLGTVSPLTYNYDSKDYSIIGAGGVVGILFDDGSIKSDNLSMAGTISASLPESVSAPTSTVKAGAGGIVGYVYLNGSSLNACKNNADISGNMFIGGVAGTIFTPTADSVTDIYTCENFGLVTCSATASDTTSLGHYFGGISGYTTNVKLTLCSSTAGYSSDFSFMPPDDPTERAEYLAFYLRGDDVGGILGSGNTTVMNDCTTKTKGYVLGNKYVGGIVGSVVGSVTESIQVTTISVTTNASYVIGNEYVGGITGINKSGSILKDCANNGIAAGYGKYIGGVTGYNEATATVENCASYISDTNGTNKTLVSKWDSSGDCSGGLVGYNDGTIRFVSSTSSSAISHSVASIVVGRNYVGGLVGLNAENGVIDVDYKLIGGQVIATGDAVGGLIGLNASPLIFDSHLATIDSGSRTVFLSIKASNVTGRYYVGGAIGANVVNLTKNETLSRITMNNGLGVITAEAFCGGIIGYNRSYNPAVIGGKTVWEYIESGAAAKLLPLIDTQTVYADGLPVNAPVRDATFLSSASNYSLTITHKDNTDTAITTPSNDLTIRSFAYTGGIVGYCDPDTRLIIKNVKNTGRISLPTDTTSPLSVGTAAAYYLNQMEGYSEAAAELSDLRFSFVGGIVGVNGTQNIIDHCENSGSLTDFTAIGGITGVNQGGVFNCRLVGNMGSSSMDYIGGIVGINIGNSLLSVDSAPGISYSSFTYKPGCVRTCSTGGGNTVSGRLHVGGIIGSNMLYSTVIDCASDANVSGQSYIGGLIGKNSGLLSLTGTVGTATRSVVGTGSYVGGIIGENSSAGSVTANGTGDVIVTDEMLTVRGRQYVGGIIGENSGAFGTTGTNCYITNKAKLVRATEGYAGGIVGNHISSAPLDHAKNLGEVAANYGYAGGIVPINRDGSTISNCINGGDVTSSNGYVSGIAAVNGGLITSCSTYGDASNYHTLTSRGVESIGAITSLNENTGIVEGITTTDGAVFKGSATKIGALAGENFGIVRLSTVSSAPRISVSGKSLTVGGAVGINRYAVTNVTCQASFENFTTYKYLGGVVGENTEGSTVGECTFSGSLQEKSSKAGNCYGGIVGLNEGTTRGSALNNFSIIATGVYTATGTSTYAQKEALSTHIGGVVGKNAETGLVTACTIDGTYNTGHIEQILDHYETITVPEKTETRTEYYWGTPNPAKFTASRTYRITFTTTDSVVKVKTITSNQFTKNSYSNNSVSVSFTYTDALGDHTQTLTLTVKNNNSTAGSASATINRFYTSNKKYSSRTVNFTYTAEEYLSRQVTEVVQEAHTEEVPVYKDVYVGATNYISVSYGMVGGVAGYNLGRIENSGDRNVATYMSGITGTSDSDFTTLKANLASISPDANYVTNNTGLEVEALSYSGTGSVKVAANRSMGIIVSVNGNLGGITGYNAPSGEISRCVSGNWILVNKSESLGVGTGGVIGMNEGEKDLTYLVNRAFVGRQLKKGVTDRFAGGIIGTQSNSTTSGWTIKGCINYGTVYCRNTHYSGGIVGQWTKNGGTITQCLNYGMLQTTYAQSYSGASAGIVAQLYHATSDQSFNIISCENHGSVYRASGTSGDGANDSAGILGNVTAYSSSVGQSYTINVIDCVNGPGVKIYSASMAAGIVCYFSDDAKSGTNIARSTDNIVLNVDRCRNYANVLNGGQNFYGGIFGNRYTTTNAHLNTNFTNCFSARIDTHPFIAMNEGTRPNLVVPDHVTNNYYFDVFTSYGTVADSKAHAQSGTVNNQSQTEYLYCAARHARLITISDGKNTIGYAMALIGNLSTKGRSDNATTDTISIPNIGTNRYCYIDENNVIRKRSDDTQVGVVLFRLDKSNYSINGTNGITLAGSKFDDLVREYYRSLEGSSGASAMSANFTAALSADNGEYTVSVSPTSGTLSRPLYYEVEFFAKSASIAETSVVKGFKLFPTGNSNNPSDTFHVDLPEEFAGQSGVQISAKVRAVSLYGEDAAAVAPSAWVQSPYVSAKALPNPSAVGYLSGANYIFTLENPSDYTQWRAAYTSETGTWTNASSSITLGSNANSQLLYVQGRKLDTDGTTYLYSPETTVGVFVPANGTPEVNAANMNATFDGDSLETLTITAEVQGSAGASNTAPVYRVELVGDGVVYKSEEVLLTASESVFVTFRDIPEEFINCTARSIRTWYAETGLGPVKTYRSTTTTSGNSIVKILNDDGTYSYLESTIISGATGSLKRTYDLSTHITTLTAPELIEPTNTINAKGELIYTFSWDGGGTGTARYSVSLVGLSDADDEENIVDIDVSRDGAHGYDSESGDRSFTVNADNWTFEKVRLKVTRLGEVSADGKNASIGLSSEGTYDALQRLTQPGAPIVENTNAHELYYRIEFGGIADETHCERYDVFANNTLVASIGADGRGTYVIEDVDLESFSGTETTFYIVAVSNTASFKDSPHGITSALLLPTRLDPPVVGMEWDFKMTFEGSETDLEYSPGKPVTIDDFRDDLSVIFDSDSTVPGGSAYLLQALVYNAIDDADPIAVFPSEDSYIEMDPLGENLPYSAYLTNFDTSWAGKYIVFQVRISGGSSGHISSISVASETQQLPYVKLDTPETVLDYVPTELPVMLSDTPDLAGTPADWSASRQVISWKDTANANAYVLTVDGVDYVVSHAGVTCGGEAVEIDSATGNYVILRGTQTNGIYFTGEYYNYTLDTLLAIKDNGDGTFTYELHLANVNSIYDSDGYTVQTATVVNDETISVKSTVTENLTDTPSAQFIASEPVVYDFGI